MTKQIIWLHEKGLKLTDEIKNHQANGTRVIHIWDESYYQKRRYSLKRLIFIYETLAEAEIEIIKGDTIEIIKTLKADIILTPKPSDRAIKELCNKIATITNLQTLEETAFASIPEGFKFTRFFKYWNKAQKTAFLINGRADA